MGYLDVQVSSLVGSQRNTGGEHFGVLALHYIRGSSCEFTSKICVHIKRFLWDILVNFIAHIYSITLTNTRIFPIKKIHPKPCDSPKPPFLHIRRRAQIPCRRRGLTKPGMATGSWWWWASSPASWSTPWAPSSPALPTEPWTAKVMISLLILNSFIWSWQLY